MDLSASELRALIHRAIALKAQRKAGDDQHSLAGKILAMIFTKASTRTRVSFEAGITQLGGSALFLSGADTQLGRGEPIEDSARVISSMVDLVMIRTFAHRDVERFAEHSAVPSLMGSPTITIPASCSPTCKPFLRCAAISAAIRCAGLATVTMSATLI
jgi:ornithine carbamoyltransferase